MNEELEYVQTLIDNFESCLTRFSEKNNIQISETQCNSGSGLKWKNFVIRLRDDLYLYDLELNESNGILSYCTEFPKEVMGEYQATFQGKKRLVLFPNSNDDWLIDTPEDFWFFISKQSEIDRFLVFLLNLKRHANNFA
ncbi:TPA: hypothetical protein ACPZH1_000551 [Yersinia enterocolitica]